MTRAPRLSRSSFGVCSAMELTPQGLTQRDIWRTLIDDHGIDVPHSAVRHHVIQTN